MAGYQCPFCGRVFVEHCELIPPHNYTPKEQQPGIHVSAYCPGTGQHPRNPESDRRALWSEEAPAAELAKTVDEIQVAQFRAFTHGIKHPLVLLEPVGQDADGAFKSIDKLAYADRALIVDDPKTPAPAEAVKAVEWWKTVQDGKPRQCLPTRLHPFDLPGRISGATVDVVQVDADGFPVALSLGFPAPTNPKAEWDLLVRLGCVTVNEWRERNGLPTLAEPEGSEPYGPDPVNGVVALPFTEKEAEAAGMFAPGCWNANGKRWNPVNGSTDLHDPANWGGSTPTPTDEVRIQDDDPAPFVRGPADGSK